ncbi:phosphopantetheine-binding protein [Streptomyces sp. TRM 70351]|uniref:phosphopantetheine-binding protein n=1 Tax=Streptomyces sp. TRM 70351 TaxID=3116552 RepID=UPI002E7B04A5|nr:phosphopantetheine-binding protein [Streptomyces sp. TRM 70351]MEE1928910.1 phosphopantetheine-binding protein [Streptomyces sp. TRM 70351]
MSPEDQPLAAASDAAPAAVAADLIPLLADVLKVRPEQLDAGLTFRSMGIGSVATLQFLSVVNARYGTSLQPTSLFAHPTLLAFAAHVVRETGAGQRGTASARPATPASREILGFLRERLAGVLGCEPAALDPSVPFNLLGVDSIRGAKLVAAINDAYGLNEPAVTLRDHPGLAAMAAHIAHVVQADAPPAADERRTGDERGTGQQLAADEELGALLDAVRADRLSVDEALTRLPRQA